VRRRPLTPSRTRSLGLPTDRADHIVHAGDKVWAGFYTNLRSPTWLLVVNPERYCVYRDRYRACIASAGGRAASKSGPSVRASDLGLVGHSGGLSHKGKQLTEFQSAWHDELRDLYDKHAPSNAYDAYWIDLQNFISTTFLFVAAPSLPLGGADVKGASNDDVIKGDRLGPAPQQPGQPVRRPDGDHARRRGPSRVGFVGAVPLEFVQGVEERLTSRR